MNRVYIQLWEESIKNENPLSDGCSIHLDLESLNSYVESIYLNRTGKVPIRYERVVGQPMIAFIEDEIFEKIKNQKNIRLSQTEMINMLKFDNILVK